MFKVEESKDQIIVEIDKNNHFEFLKKGASINGLTFNGTNIIVGFNDLSDFSAYRSSWLFPFPNRLDHGRFEFQGTSYEFPRNEPTGANALHGFLYDMHFDVLDQTSDDDSFNLSFGLNYDGEYEYYPFPFAIKITYQIKKGHLGILIEITNSGKSAMPYAVGWHPYFMLDNPIDELLLRMPGSQRIEIDEFMIPTDNKIDYNELLDFTKLKGLNFDTGFLVNENNYKVNLRSDNIDIQMVMDSSWPYFQIFIPGERDSIALEPMTGNIDCFNNGEGLSVIEAGESRLYKLELILTTL